MSEAERGELAERIAAESQARDRQGHKERSVRAPARDDERNSPRLTVIASRPALALGPAANTDARWCNSGASSRILAAFCGQWDNPTMVVTLDAKRRLTVPAALAPAKPGDYFDAHFDAEEDAIVFRRLGGAPRTGSRS